jgi:hypothetical protein
MRYWRFKDWCAVIGTILMIAFIIYTIYYNLPALAAMKVK